MVVENSRERAGSGRNVELTVKDFAARGKLDDLPCKGASRNEENRERGVLQCVHRRSDTRSGLASRKISWTRLAADSGTTAS